MDETSPAHHVMVIDSCQTVREKSHAFLHSAGYGITTVSNGFEALAVIVANPPDIAFVDAHLPGLDGYQTCSLINNNPQFTSIRLILLTCDESSVCQEKARLAGAMQTLSKPLEKDRMLHAMHTFLADRP